MFHGVPSQNCSLLFSADPPKGYDRNTSPRMEPFAIHLYFISAQQDVNPIVNVANAIASVLQMRFRKTAGPSLVAAW